MKGHRDGGISCSGIITAFSSRMYWAPSDFLTNGTSDDLAESSLTDKELLNQFKAIEKMPERDKDVVKTLIDAFITKGKLKQLVL